MKKVIISIGIVIVIIICLIIAILVVRNNNNGSSSTGDASSTYEQNVEKAAKETVTEQQAKELIYNVEQCVSSYLAIINTNNSSYFSYDENGNEEKFVNENEKILNILSKEFIDENHITVDNIDNYVDKLNQDVFFIPLKANYLKNGYMYKYAINGYISDFNYNVIKNISLIVNLDITNLTFSIEPLENYVDNVEDIKLNNTLEEIAKNDDNAFSYISTNAEDEAKRYLDEYKKMALSNPEEAYNHLNEEYRNKRFESLQAYEQYIQENINDMKIIQLNQYMINRNGDITQYVCKDKYGKIYMFDAKNPLDYSIQLDTYTIPTDTFKEQYDNGDVQTKVQMNINKFILMINNQDYQAAYDVLDDNFKNNYFKTIDDFKNYVKQYAYKYNNMQVDSFDVNGNVYSCGVSLSDATNGAYVDESKGTGGSGYIYSWNFYMQLNDGYDFTLSFEVK